MLLAVVFALIVVTAGYGTLRSLGLAKGPTGLGLTPAAGLAALTIVATWSGLVRLPPPVPAAIVGAVALAGLGLAVRDRQPIWCAVRAIPHREWLSAGVLGMALGVPPLALGLAFAGVQAPLSPHDGAFHVETIDLFRRGSVSPASWYPPGVAALFGAVLQWLPGVDTAAGGYELGLSLALLAPLAAFGSAAAVWRNLFAASASALLLSFTYLFPYFPQVWSGWPQTVGLLLALGLWTVALDYVDRPGWSKAVLAGLLVGAIVLVHGTELYTGGILVSAAALAARRRLPWQRLRSHAPAAVALAVVCAAPYLPALIHWAGAGGAYAAGFSDGRAVENGAKSSTAVETLGVFTVDALGVDLPVRLVLIGLGVGYAVRQQTGRMLVAVAAFFGLLATTFSFLTGAPGIREVYAATFPWSLPFRQLMFATPPLALLAGGGCVALVGLWTRGLARVRGVAARRRVQRAGRLLVVTWALVASAALIGFLSIPRGLLASFSADDATAMAWLRVNVRPDEVVANDSFADAGIWAPYKAGVAILDYRGREGPGSAAERQLIQANVARLEAEPAAAATACALHVRYVYYGAEASGWQPRVFPPLEALRGSTALETVFSQGQATVFRIRQTC